MYLSKETLSRHTGLGKTMQTSLREIKQKAKKDKTYKFRNLYRLLNRELLKLCWKNINKNDSAGVDKVTAKVFKENLDNNIDEIVSELKGKRYHAKLVKRVYIPKNKDKTRPLGIPSMKDKLVQSAVAKILECIYEQDFIKDSYGYRPKVGAQTAIKSITDELHFGKYSYIVEADIKGFFNNISHEWLIKMLSLRIDDKAFINLVRKWLKAGILEVDGQIIHPATGTPQGGIISPILANIYLHYVLDLWFEKVVKKYCTGEAYLCRYADDFICAFRYKEDAERFFKALALRLNKFGLGLAPEKTNIISFSRFRKQENTYFEFLGFEYRWGVSAKGKDIIKRATSRKKLRQSILSFKNWCRENKDNRTKKILDMLNIKLRGYYNYYGIIGNSKSLWRFYNIAIRTLYKRLNRRSQRRSFNFIEFTSMIKRYGVFRPYISEKSGQQLSFNIDFA